MRTRHSRSKICKVAPDCSRVITLNLHRLHRGADLPGTDRRRCAFSEWFAERTGSQGQPQGDALSGAPLTSASAKAHLCVGVCMSPGCFAGRRVLGQFGEHDRRAVGKFRNDANVASHCFDRLS
jgi:hypothetical protein